MGYKYNAKKVTCPLFTRVVKTTHGQFIGIECEPIEIHLGFTVSPVVRIETSEELKDYTEIFCKDCFEDCPYYKAHFIMRKA